MSGFSAAAAAFESNPHCCRCGHAMPVTRTEPMCPTCETLSAQEREAQSDLVRSFGALKLRLMLRSDWPAPEESPKALRWLMKAQPPSHERMMNEPPAVAGSYLQQIAGMECLDSLGQP